MVNVGERIRQRREQLGWSATKLATLAGVTQSMISRAESGKSRLSEENLYKVAGALAIAVEKLYASDSNIVDAPPDTRTVPLLDYVQAGRWMTIQSNVRDGDVQETVPTNLDYPPSTFALKIRGNSMEPRFSEGDVVIIAPTIKPRPGDFVVATDENGDGTFKRFRDAGLDQHGRSIFELVALNPDYGPMRSDRQKIAIVGTMIEHRSYRKP